MMQVLVLRASGSPELELVHEIVGDDQAQTLSAAMRRQLYFVEMGRDARPASELRLSKGGLLELHFPGVKFSGPLGEAIAHASHALQVPAEASTRLADLCRLFAEAGLPSELQLAVITPRERSLLSLLGLHVGKDLSSAIPLAFSGSGTAQLSMFRLAAALIEGRPIVSMDEPEIGLEPYRQRRLIADVRSLVGVDGQAFITTHSPTILEALEPGELVRLDANGVSLPLNGLAPVLREMPETFLCHMPVLCEGPTEAGLLATLLAPRAARDGINDLDARGIVFLSRDQYGQPHVLQDAELLADAGIRLALFVDAETSFGGRRERLVLGTWIGIRNIEEAVASWLPLDALEQVVTLAASLAGRNVVACYQQVAEMGGCPGRGSLSELANTIGEPAARSATAKAMQNRQGWFKSRAGGAALGRLLIDVGVPEQIDNVIEDFWSRLKKLLQWA